MAFIASYIESALGTLLYRVREHDDQLFLRACEAASESPSEITITSPDLGATSPGVFEAGKHDLLGNNIFPELSWSFPTDKDLRDSIKSWLLIVEDADAPLPSPVVHGIYYDIPASTTSLAPNDLTPIEESTVPESCKLFGGFCFGANRRGTVWTGPRPVLGHGPHRYYFQLLGLRSGELWKENRRMTKADLMTTPSPLDGNVLCKGEYVAVFERKL